MPVKENRRKSVASSAPVSGLTSRAQQLAAENLQADVYDLNQPNSVLDRGQHKTTQGLRDQIVGPAARIGLAVAARRGLACLVCDYQFEYFRWVKQQARVRAVAHQGPDKGFGRSALQ